MSSWSKRYSPDSLEERRPEVIRALLPALQLLNRRYLHLQADGFDALPDEPTLFVANHNGGIAGPDLSCTMASLWEALGPDAPLFALAHDAAMRQLTPFGRLMQKVGCLSATPANARRALASGASVLVYPGGDLDAYRLSARRNEVVFGERQGFIRVALASGVPIVPIVAQGAHRSAWIFSEGKRLARALRMKSWARIERFPLAFALPWGFVAGPYLPYLPLPFPVRLRALPAMRFPKDIDPRKAREAVRSAMQRCLSALARDAGDLA